MQDVNKLRLTDYQVYAIRVGLPFRDGKIFLRVLIDDDGNYLVKSGDDVINVGHARQHFIKYVTYTKNTNGRW